MPDADQLVRAREIEAIVLDARKLMAQHQISLNAAARALQATGVRVSPASLSRWSGEYTAGGLLALCPGRSTGRPKHFNFTEDEKKRLRQLKHQTGSTPMALQLLAESRLCSAQTRAAIEAVRGGKSFPLSARRAAYITPEEVALFRGPRAFELLYYTTARSMEWTDENNVRALIRPGDFWEFDDMSVNKPYWYEWPYGGDPLSDRHGVRLGRQALIARDVRGKWLGCDLIGRVRDAYRAEDVLRFIHRLFQDYGVPLGIRLELGVWASRIIDGVLVDGPTPDDIQEAWAGVNMLCRVQHVHSPHAKGIIEGGFDLLQKRMGVYGVGIGRRRGEMEAETADLLACQAGRRHPKDCGFPHIDAVSKQLDEAFRWLNEREMNGRLLRGVADDLWRQRMADHGPLGTLPRELEYVLCPAKGERAMKGGHINITLAHYAKGLFSFRVPVDKWPYLGTGYRLRYAFDPAEPSAGCHLFNAEMGVRNQHHLSRGYYLGIAPHDPERSQFDFSGAAPDATGRKQAAAAARTVYRQVAPRGETGRKLAQAVDGEGNVVRAEIGGRPKTAEIAAEGDNNTVLPPACGERTAFSGMAAPERVDGTDLDAMRLRNDARRRERLEALGVFDNED